MIAMGTAVRGRLALVFAARGGGTVLAHADVHAPLKIVRPFQLADGRVLVQILALGPGLCAGDEYAIDVTVERNASAVVIMQSASRIIGMPAGARAAQNVKLAVDAGGQLEYYPGLTIPFRDSRFVQRVHVDAAADSRLGILETWATGRSGRGEHLAFRGISSRTMVRVDGAPVYADATELAPAEGDVAGTGVLEGHRYFASGFWLNASIEPVHELAVRDGLLSAFGQTTPHRVYLRALSRDGYAMSEATNEAVRTVNAAWGLVPIPLRRFTS
jgi:urease accessory protein